MDLPYEHVQIGWVILGSLLLPVPILVVPAGLTGSSAPLLVVALLALVFAGLFGTLKVRVDNSAISLKFGIGIIQRRYTLSDLRSFAEVQNPWYYGWGIRYYPGGTLYNVSGLDAVELVLNGGKRVRIGTNESAKLFLVLESILGTPIPLSELPVSEPRQGLKKVRLITISVVLAALLGLPFLLHFQSRPPVVTLTAKSLTIDNLFYGQSYRLSDIRKLELMQSLPAIRVRTNGYAAGGTLRGWFSLNLLGQGKLFVEAGQPPYIAIYLQDGFVILNYSDPQETRRLYGAIRQVLPSKATESAPTSPL